MLGRGSKGGYADLLLAGARGGAPGLAAMAALLGYEPTAPTPPDRWEPPPADPGPAADTEAVAATPDPVRRPLDEPPFWRLERRSFLTPSAPSSPAATTMSESPPWPGLPPPPPPGTPLSRWPVLVPSLREAFTRRSDGRRPDIAAMIGRLGQGRTLDRVPHLKRRRWGAAVYLIVDRSPRLTPFWRDQDRAVGWLAALFPRHGVEQALVLDESVEPVGFGRHGARRDRRAPEPGTLVVVLGDLGCLARPGG
jgi:hypothetical protein